MKRINSVLLAVVAAIICLLAGCGRQEQRQMGIDGFVYTTETLETGQEANTRNFTAAGGYLYYVDSGTLQRLPLDKIGNGSRLTGGETVLTISDVLHTVAADNGGSFGAFSGADIRDYTIASDGSIYCILAADDNKSSISSILNGSYNPEEKAEKPRQTSASGLLYKRSPDGETAYWLTLPQFRVLQSNPDWLAIDSQGTAYVLTAEAILAIDENGGITDKLPVTQADSLGSPGTEGRLQTGNNGQVYYVAQKPASNRMDVFLIENDTTLQMTPISMPSILNQSGLYEGMDCLLEASYDSLFQYTESENALTEILRWGESGLLGHNITNAVQIDADRYIATVSNHTTWQNILLTKTPVSEIPEKEIIVIASLSPTYTMRESIASFNQSSDKYFVRLETYGADSYDDKDAQIRLDSSLVSRNTPDILDFMNLDIVKYADKGMLEDLSPFMEGEDTIRKDNYLGNLLDGYTINGKLVSIPRAFAVPVVYGITPESSTLEDWSIPGLMALTQKHPEKMLMMDSVEYLLNTFCAPYYLEQFVDWEKRSCSFEGDEFCAFLNWIAHQEQTYSGKKDALFQLDSIRFFDDHMSYCLRYGENMTIHGFPSADGSGKYSVMTLDTMAILSSSVHKEGAWEFLRFFLAEDVNAYWLPTRLDLLEMEYQEAITPTEFPKGFVGSDGVTMEYYAMKPEQADTVMRIIESIDFTPRNSAENSIIEIVWEEAQYLLDGSKTAKAAAQAIQNRAELVLQEKTK